MDKNDTKMINELNELLHKYQFAIRELRSRYDCGELVLALNVKSYTIAEDTKEDNSMYK